MLGITDVMAAGTAAAAQPSVTESLMGMAPMFAVMFGLFYFMIIRPQGKKAKEHRSLIDSIKVGDEVLTNGGLMAKVAEVHEGLVKLAVSDTVVLTIQKSAIGSVLPKGTLESSVAKAG